MLRKLKLTVIICLAALTAFASTATANAAGSYFLSEGFYYGVKNGEAYVHGYEGSDWDMVIRETFLRYYVTSIEEYAFYENESIERLSFYDATRLKHIGDGAFMRCENLELVNITSTIEEMGVGVFEGCTSLRYVRYRSGSLSDIPAQTFYGCDSLQTVIFENDVKSIGAFAFGGCASLKRVTIPNTIESIAPNAFDGCDENFAVYAKPGDDNVIRLCRENNIPLVRMFDLGDCNLDGKINVSDVTAIQRHLTEIEPFTNEQRFAADTNGDGEITVDDATLLQRYLAEYDVKLG